MLLNRLRQTSYLKKGLEEAIAIFGSEALDPLLEILKTQCSNNYCRSLVSSTCQILCHYKEPRMFDVLAEIIKFFPESRGAAAEALAGLRDSRCIPLLRESIMTHGLAYSRKILNGQIDSLFKPLVQLGSESAAVFIDLLSHKDAEVREQAALALEIVVDLGAVQPLMRALDDPARFRYLYPVFFPGIALGEEMNFVAEAATKALEAIVRTCPEKLSEDSLNLLAHLKHRQKSQNIKIEGYTDFFFSLVQGRTTYKIEERYGPDCRRIRTLANNELSKRHKRRLQQALA